MFVLGDFNAHGTAWGEEEDDSRSQLLYEVFEEFQLNVLNTGEITRVAAPSTRSSRIDLSLCSASLSLNCSWLTLPDLANSDHVPILVTYRSNNIEFVDMPADLCRNID